MDTKPQTELVKGLGVYGATSVAAGTMIGTAIFVVPGIMLQQVGTPSMVLLVFLAAGVLSLFGALAYAELGAALPQCRNLTPDAVAKGSVVPHQRLPGPAGHKTAINTISATLECVFKRDNVKSLYA